MPSSPTWVGSTSLLELPDSPSTEFGEKTTRTRSYVGPYTTCLSSALARGTIGTGSEAGFNCARSIATRESGDRGRLTISWEAAGSSSGAELPPTKFSCKPKRILRNLRYHPKYSTLTDALRESIDKAIAGDAKAGNSDYNAVAADTLAFELFKKLKRGTEGYWVSVMEYTYTYASWTLPSLTLGGFIGTPGGPMAGSLPATTGWFRASDEIDFDSGYYSVTVTWLGSPDGDWDDDLY
jgi:hypothetical protein